MIMTHAIPSSSPLSRLLPLALVLVLAGGAGADAIPDGYKNIGSTLLIEGTERFPEMTFALFPAHILDDRNGGPIHDAEGKILKSRPADHQARLYLLAGAFGLAVLLASLVIWIQRKGPPKSPPDSETHGG